MHQLVPLAAPAAETLIDANWLDYDYDPTRPAPRRRPGGH